MLSRKNKTPLQLQRAAVTIGEVIEYPLRQNCQPKNSRNFHRRAKVAQQCGKFRKNFFRATSHYGGARHQVRNGRFDSPRKLSPIPFRAAQIVKLGRDEDHEEPQRMRIRTDAPARLVRTYPRDLRPNSFL
jgi:hypothetical protein